MTHRPALLLALALPLLPAPARATGGGDDGRAFAPTATPENMELFLAGHLGVLRPDLRPRDRAVAYRLLVGAPLDDATRKALAAGAPDESQDAAPVKAWLAARAATVPGATDPPGLKSGDVQYGYDFANCHADAFATAAATAKQRATRFGAGSREVREWLAAQDVVFANCDPYSQNKGQLPPDKIPNGVAAPIQKDRDYQVAAAHFYSSQLDLAKAAFARIADDAASPWRTTARFLVARTAVREANRSDTPDAGKLAEAARGFEAVLADPSAQALHASARRMLRLCALHTQPEAQLVALSKLIWTESGDDLRWIVLDFDRLATDEGIGARATDGAAVDRLSAGVPLLDWTLSWQLPPPARLERAVARADALPWLLMALATVEGKDARANALMDAARKIRAGSAAYPMAAFHRARLLVEQGRVPAARALLDDALATKELPPGTLDELRRLRFAAARSLDDALPAVARVPIDEGEGPYEAPRAETAEGLDLDGAWLFYLREPLAASARAALDPRLPASVRGELASVGFLRAALLDDVETARSLVRAFAAAHKNDAPLADAWAAAATPADRRHALVRLWLRDDWLALAARTESELAPGICGATVSDEKAPPPPSFVDEKARAAAAAETARLAALVGDPAVFRADEITAWARSHPTDPDAPEDLHHAVLGAKHYCGDAAKATAASKRAFKALHELFPSSSWAKKTRYWYP